MGRWPVVTRQLLQQPPSSWRNQFLGKECWTHSHRGDAFGYFTPTFFFSQASFELISTHFHCCPLPSNPSERSNTPPCPNSSSLGCEDVSIRELGERVCCSMLMSLVFLFLFLFQPHPYRPTCSRTSSFLLSLLRLPFCARFPLLGPWVFDMRNDFQQNGCVIY